MCLCKGERRKAIKKKARFHYPIASKVSNQEIREEAAAACRLGAFHCKTLMTPVMEVVNPTTPATREKITTNPVAKFPNG